MASSTAVLGRSSPVRAASIELPSTRRTAATPPSGTLGEAPLPTVREAPGPRGPRGLSGRDDRERARPMRAQGSARAVELVAFATFGGCTATHLGRGLFLTAASCLGEAPKVGPCPRPLRASDRPTALACEVVTVSSDLDLALLQSTTRDLPSVELDPQPDWARRPRRWVRLYDHTAGTLRMNGTCLATFDPRAERVVHTCDTDPDDRGNLLLDRDSGRAIAVHAGPLPGSLSNVAYSVDRLPRSALGR